MADVAGNNHAKRLFWTEIEGGLRAVSTTPGKGKVLAEYVRVDPAPSKKRPVLRFFFRPIWNRFDFLVLFASFFAIPVVGIWIWLAILIAGAVFSTTIERKFKEYLK
jgi:hypothetical protein